MKFKTQLHSINQSRAIKPTLLLPLSIHFEPNYTREKDFANAFSEIDVIKIPEYLIDNIFAIFGGRIFQQKVDIPIGYQPCSFSTGTCIWSTYMYISVDSLCFL